MAGTKNLYNKFPEEPGVYIMKGRGGRILYIGKAANLKRRVSSYFTRPHDARIQKLVSQIRHIDYRETPTALEALILESLLIKKHEPPFNVREKDDKSFLYIEITKESFPRVVLIRGKEIARSVKGELFGPFTSAQSLREALRILRRIFPWNTHPPEAIEEVQLHPERRRRACFDAQIGLCPGTCMGVANRRQYQKTIQNLKLVLHGKTQTVLKSLERDMRRAARALAFEEAARIRRQVFALRHVRDVALIGEDEFLSGRALIDRQATRIEGYDISNISGTSAVGSMVVFINSEPDTNEYRKFKIRTIHQSDDTGMLREVLLRRFGNEWPLPTLVLIDGGKGQVNTAERVLDEVGLKIPVVGIAKGPTRKKNEFIGTVPKGIDPNTLIKVRNEAHRSAIFYHRAVRGRQSLGST